MSHRITTRIEQWVETALDKFALGDRVSWDCSFAQTTEGPQMLLVFFMPGAILGSVIQNGLVLQHITEATEFDIEETVKRALEDLRNSRSAQSTVPAQPSLLSLVNGG